MEFYAWTPFTSYTKILICESGVDCMCVHFSKTCTISCCHLREFSSLNYARRCTAIFATKLGETILMQATNEAGFFWRCFCAVLLHQQDSTSIY